MTKLPRRQFLHLAAGAAAFISLASVALAQNWPAQPITMVVPFAAGGATDVVARILVPRLSELLGQQVVVENVGGAGGMTGASRVAKAAADGYQFLMGVTGTHAQNQTLYKRPLYNAITDFAPVGLVAVGQFALITRKDLPVKNLQEFMAYARANRSKMQFGSAGAGSGTHITCLLFNSAVGVEITHVPYRSTAQAMPDMLAGRLDYICEPIQTALPLIQEGNVKAIATLSRERSPALPNLPTAHEQGLTDFDAPTWWALFFPNGTPAPILNRLNKALSETLDDPMLQARFASGGLVIPPVERRSPEYLAKFVHSEIEKWAAPIKASGVSMD